MNKKMIELYDIAADLATQECIVRGLVPQPTCSMIGEKFAELIVRECASICELNGKSYQHSFTPAKARLAESTSVFCGELIKKHFGVK